MGPDCLDIEGLKDLCSPPLGRQKSRHQVNFLPDLRGKQSTFLPLWKDGLAWPPSPSCESATGLSGACSSCSCPAAVQPLLGSVASYHVIGHRPPPTCFHLGFLLRFFRAGLGLQLLQAIVGDFWPQTRPAPPILIRLVCPNLN